MNSCVINFILCLNFVEEVCYFSVNDEVYWGIVVMFVGGFIKLFVVLEYDNNVVYFMFF